jgi:hypothetical protein
MAFLNSLWVLLELSVTSSSPALLRANIAFPQPARLRAIGSDKSFR